MADENVPHGISEKQDEIIQYVAKYVVSSCDGARYQEKIRTRTKYNSYFAFLDAKHPYHNYYQYLLDSYRYYMLNSEAVNAGGWGGDGSGALGHQQQLTEEEYYQYHGAYQSQTGGIGFQGGEVEGEGEYAQQSAAASNAEGGDGTGALAGAGSGATATAAASGEAGAVQDGATSTSAPAEGGEEEEDEEAYELVMENGEWVSRKRS